jgi:hypothetical protein
LEEVKLNILEEHGLQWRMTGNNEEILPPKLSNRGIDKER